MAKTIGKYESFLFEAGSVHQYGHLPAFIFSEQKFQSHQ